VYGTLLSLIEETTLESEDVADLAVSFNFETININNFLISKRIKILLQNIDM
jgi:hypothetical protein